MNCCLGCFALMVILVVGIMLIQAIAPFWAPILAISLSLMWVRYLRAFSTYREDE